MNVVNAKSIDEIKKDNRSNIAYLIGENIYGKSVDEIGNVSVKLIGYAKPIDCEDIVYMRPSCK